MIFTHSYVLSLWLAQRLGFERVEFLLGAGADFQQRLPAAISCAGRWPRVWLLLNRWGAVIFAAAIPMTWLGGRRPDRLKAAVDLSRRR
jgi:hypothetical protein